LTSNAIVTTDKPVAYMRQLCKHFGHRVPTSYDDSTGRIEFESGDCNLSAGTDELTLEVSAAESDQVQRLKDVVGSHLERFGRRDQLTVSWPVGRLASP
jgi:hypothetical protein